MTFQQILTQAKTTSQLTAAEFDHSLATGDTSLAGALHHLGNAIHRAANPGDSGSAADRADRARALNAKLTPQIEALITAARGKSYTGWSDASSGPIRYGQ